MRTKSRIFVTTVWLTAIACLHCKAEATLYMLDVSGVLLQVDQQTGTTSEVIAHIGSTSWSGLTPSATEDTVLYALHNPRPALFEDPQFSQLARIDVEAQSTTLFPFFDSDVLEVSELFSMGVAISPQQPNTAIVVGNDREIPPTAWIWEVNVDDGSVVEAARALSNVRRLESLTFNLDGSVLYGMNQEGHLVSVDPSTAVVTEVGDPGLTDFVTGIAFHPDSGELFAINGLQADQLVQLDPDTGELLRVIGDLGIKGPDGLAFLPSPFSELDCNQDGSVNVDDLDCANAADITADLLNELRILPGDLDGMDGVNFDDFIVFADSFGRPRGKYNEGDINDDGRVNFDDFRIFAANFGRSFTAPAGEAAVPEPSALSLCAWLVAATILLRQMKHRSSF